MQTKHTHLAVGYVRCSTDMQDGSIQQQKDELSAWAGRNGLMIIRWYVDEGKSGTTFLERPGFCGLLADVEAGADFTYVLVYDESRWGRPGNPRENSYWKMHFERHGVHVRVVNSQSKHQNDIGSYVVEVVESAEASEYSKKISRSTLRGAKANAEKGYSSGGTAPYGYKRIAVSRTTGLFIRELPSGVHAHKEDERVSFDLGDVQEIRVVQGIFQWRLQGLGYRSIANKLNADDVPCPRRGRWRNKDQKWSSNTIREILRNPVYCGWRVFNRHPQSHITGRSKAAWYNDQGEWIIKRDAHPSLISNEVFRAANEHRKKYTRQNRHFYESPYLLSGLVVCNRCQFNFQGQTKKSRSADGKIKLLRYYEDSGYTSKGHSVCRSFLLRSEELENFVLGQITKMLRGSDFVEKATIALRERLRDRRQHGNYVNELSTKLEGNQKALHSLLQLVRNGADLQEINDEILSIQKERKYLEEQLSSLQSHVVSERDIESLADQVRVLVDDFKTTFRKAPLHLQKNLIRRFVHRVVIDPIRNTVSCHMRRVPYLDHQLMVRTDFGHHLISMSIRADVKASRKAHWVNKSGWWKDRVRLIQPRKSG